MSATTLPVSSTGEGRFEASALAPALPLLPRNAVLALLHGYRATVSHLYGDVCKYYPSCSAYALEAVTVHGAWRGTGLALHRLAHCHPWSLGGYDPVPGTPAAAEWAREQAASEPRLRGAT